MEIAGVSHSTLVDDPYTLHEDVRMLAGVITMSSHTNQVLVECQSNTSWQSIASHHEAPLIPSKRPKFGFKKSLGQS